MTRLLLIFLTLIITGCATPTPINLDAFNAAAPRSVLVVPVVNKSLDVDAPNYVLSALPVPLAEKGYYVFPVHTVKFILEQEGLYEGEQIHQQPAPALAKMFGADAILYVTINRWDAQYAFITTTVTVQFDYKMLSRDGTELWKARKTLQYQPQSSGGGHPLAMLIGAAISAAVARAAPNYMPLTQQANLQVFTMGATAIPDGPYSKSREIRSAR
ncbi:MAG TPA: DUF799 family lipoprotein [Burkholderiaceae bacterium]|jgi:hypothetical protein|nr:DUF799 family lipoprotein [Burkholderiaceae bacterium]